jgi:hypothetical protein
MHLIIDAVNIRSGGGYTHLRNILGNELFISSFDEVIIFTSKETELRLFKDKVQSASLTFVTKSFFSGGIVNSICYFIYIQTTIFFYRKNGILFSPGGNFYFTEYITMHRNLLPFDYCQIGKGANLLKVKMILLKLYLKIVYKFSYKTIFLNDYCRNVVSNSVKRSYNNLNSMILRHPVSDVCSVKRSFPVLSGDCLKLVYVGDFLEYKNHVFLIDLLNQWHSVIDFPFLVHFVGISYSNLKKFSELLSEAKFKYEIHLKLEKNDYVRLLDHVDISLMVSRVESYSQIVSECIARHLPVIALDVSSYKSSFGNSIHYFDGTVEDFNANILKILKGSDKEMYSDIRDFIQCNSLDTYCMNLANFLNA